MGRDARKLYWPGTAGSNGSGNVKGHSVMAATPAIKNTTINTTAVRILLVYTRYIFFEYIIDMDCTILMQGIIIDDIPLRDTLLNYTKICPVVLSIYSYQKEKVENICKDISNITIYLDVITRG